MVDFFIKQDKKELSSTKSLSSLWAHLVTMELSKLVGSYLKRKYQSFLNYTDVSQTTYITMIAGIVGVLGGFGAVGFRKLIEFFQNLAIGSSDGVILALEGLPWYVKLIVPVCGAAVVGPLIYFLAREAKGHGVPEVMQDVALKNGMIRPRLVLVKSFASAITIGTGGSVGREGPIVQIGSAIGSTIGQWLKVSPERLKILVGCGAAAGIAATFNAPIAGAFFALEIVLGNFALTSFSPIIISSVLATAISRNFLGDFPAFVVPEYALVSLWEIPLYVLLGVVAGCVSVLFSKSIYRSEDLFNKIPLPEYLKNPLGGLLIGIVIIFFPHVYGVGYETIEMALRGNLVWHLALLLIFVKLLATSLTLGSGGSGGIFAPSLFLGAVVGSLFGIAAHTLFPGITAHSGAYAMVGMGAVVAGAAHMPITSILILFELTNDYKIILALMIACTVSTIISRKLDQDSIYTKKLTRRGISLNQGREELIMKSFTVGDAMRTEAPVISEDASFDGIISAFMQKKEPYYFVVNDSNTFQGMLSIHEIKSVMNDKDLQNLIIARDMVDIEIKPVILKNNLAECMERFGQVDHDYLPVVDDEESNRLIGSISRRDIMQLYNREILHKELLGLRVVQENGEEKKRSHVSLPKEYKVDYVPLPTEFVDKSVQELDIRAKYNVTVIAVKKLGGGHSETSEIPSPESRFQSRDILVVVGKVSDVERFKKVGSTGR